MSFLLCTIGLIQIRDQVIKKKRAKIATFRKYLFISTTFNMTTLYTTFLFDSFHERPFYEGLFLNLSYVS